MGAKATEPWTGWEPTVEADPVDSDELQSARARAKVLLDAVDAHYAAEQKRSNELESARTWAVALESRLDEVRRVVEECPASLLRDCLREWLAADLIA